MYPYFQALEIAAQTLPYERQLAAAQAQLTRRARVARLARDHRSPHRPSPSFRTRLALALQALAVWIDDRARLRLPASLESLA